GGTRRGRENAPNFCTSRTGSARARPRVQRPPPETPGDCNRRVEISPNHPTAQRGDAGALWSVVALWLSLCRTQSVRPLGSAANDLVCNARLRPSGENVGK